MINVDVNICIDMAWINMLQEIIQLFAQSGNLEKHKRTCTAGQVAVAAPAAKKRRVGSTCKGLVNRLVML